MLFHLLKKGVSSIGAQPASASLDIGYLIHLEEQSALSPSPKSG